MRTRGAQGSPLQTPQLWQFWGRGSKSPAVQAAAASPAAPACASPAGGARGQGGAAEPRGDQPSAGASPAARDSPPAHRHAARHAATSHLTRPRSSRQHRRLWASLAAKSTDELQALYFEYTHFETTLKDASLLQTVYDLAGTTRRAAPPPHARSRARPAVQAGETSPSRASPALARPSAGQAQEPASAPHAEPAPLPRASDRSLAARVPLHLGALVSTHVPLLGLGGAAGGSAAAAGGAEAEGGNEARAEQAALPPSAPPALVWDVRCAEAICRVKVRRSGCSGPARC